MNGPIKNLLVGVFILGSIAICIALIMFLKPSVGDGKQTLYVRFSDIGKITVGTRVLFAGRPVGEVVKLEEIEEARSQPTDELGRVYFYELILHIDSGVKVYNTDEISIQTSGLMGEKSIAITPKAPPSGVTPRKITNQPIYADSVDSLQNALVEFSELASNMEETFRVVGNWVKEYGSEVASTLRSAGSSMQEIDQAVAAYNQSGMINDASSVMQNLRSATTDVAQGNGTIGKLITGDGLYLQLNAIISKASTLINDLNNYGLLFQLNKQWQRTRLQKINLLNALDTAQGFRTYFQNEVNDINVSMSRISMLIQRAEDSLESREILKSNAFRKDFADLLQRCDELSDNLRLYNQQLSEAADQ